MDPEQSLLREKKEGECDSNPSELEKLRRIVAALEVRGGLTNPESGTEKSCGTRAEHDSPFSYCSSRWRAENR